MGGGGWRSGASQDSKKYAGAFQDERRGHLGVRAEQLEEAMYEVLDELKKNPVSPEELQKVKNQLRVQNIRFMDMMSGIGMLFYLGPNAAMGDWAEVNNNPDPCCDQVTAEDIRRVAERLLRQEPAQRPDHQHEGRLRRATQTGGARIPRFTGWMRMIKSIDRSRAAGTDDRDDLHGNGARPRIPSEDSARWKRLLGRRRAARGAQGGREAN